MVHQLAEKRIRSEVPGTRPDHNAVSDESLPEGIRKEPPEVLAFGVPFSFQVNGSVNFQPGLFAPHVRFHYLLYLNGYSCRANALPPIFEWILLSRKRPEKITENLGADALDVRLEGSK